LRLHYSSFLIIISLPITTESPGKAEPPTAWDEYVVPHAHYIPHSFHTLQTIGYPHIIFGFFHHNDHYYIYIFWNDRNIITISPILRSDALKSPTFLLCIQSPIMFSFNRLTSLCRPDRSPNKRPSTAHGRHNNMVVVDLLSE